MNSSIAIRANCSILHCFAAGEFEIQKYQVLVLWDLQLMMGKARYNHLSARNVGCDKEGRGDEEGAG
jgi:hypothetical protein